MSAKPNNPQNPLPNATSTIVDIARLKFDRATLKAHSALQLKMLANAVREFKIVLPILIDTEFQVVVGFARVEACKLLGMRVIPAIQVDHLDEAGIQAFAIADNRISELGTWNEAALAERLKALAAVDLSFNLEATGFTMGEIDLKIASLELGMDEPGKNNPDDEMPSPGPAVCKPGDLWVLGAHRLLCATALENASFATLLNGELVDATFIDPPYGNSIESYFGSKRKRPHREFVQGSADNMSDDELQAFLATACRLIALHSREGAVTFACIDWRHAQHLLAAGNSVFDSLLNIAVWVKSNGGMGSLYRSRHELIAIFRKGKTAHRNNIQLGRYGRNRTNVWEYPGANAFIRGSEEADLLAQHATPKPVALVADALLDVTARRDIVLDCFMGSGGTLLGAERTGRRARGIELDPLFIDLAIRRWQRLTGEAAMLESTGETFDQLAERGEG